LVLLSFIKEKKEKKEEKGFFGPKERKQKQKPETVTARLRACLPACLRGRLPRSTPAVSYAPSRDRALALLHRERERERERSSGSSSGQRLACLLACSSSRALARFRASCFCSLSLGNVELFLVSQ